MEVDGVEERWIELTFTWASKPYSIKIAESDRCVWIPRARAQPDRLSRIFDLKAQLQALTLVPPERQKILGLVKGKLPPEQAKM